MVTQVVSTHDFRELPTEINKAVNSAVVRLGRSATEPDEIHYSTTSTHSPHSGVVRTYSALLVWRTS